MNRFSRFPSALIRSFIFKLPLYRCHQCYYTYVQVWTTAANTEAETFWLSAHMVQEANHPRRRFPQETIVFVIRSLSRTTHHMGLQRDGSQMRVGTVSSNTSRRMCIITRTTDREKGEENTVRTVCWLTWFVTYRVVHAVG